MDGSGFVETEMNYMLAMNGRPEFWQYRPPAGSEPKIARRWRHTLPVHDGRLEALTLEEHGVTLVPHSTRIRDFYDAEEVRTGYYAEVEALVAEHTGASRVLVFDHNVRSADRAERREDGAQKPVYFVHNDYTEKSGPQRVRDLLPDEADTLLASRFCVVNVWRPIVGPIQRSPLAVCDARSIAPDDLVETDLVYRDRRGEVYSVTHNPRHRWYYFPQMQRDEAMLIKCYDSMKDGRSRFTVHSAFEDPTSPPDAPARESIEARTLAFFS